MGRRREGRETAVQFLYQADLNRESIDDLLEHFWKIREAKPGVREFATELVRGVGAHREEIDALIKSATANYELGRLAAVDRNILRVAIYEMHHALDVPPVVAINEAIEVAKRFGAEESGGFVNGILDRLKLDLKRPAREASS